ncbi:hypothetical protein [Lentzea kentuckyensis]|uniref:hypothetical protein n=1 Tax=Lentzea kentuckyensis TaxID=360086 RepID=UPI000A37D360|nr:hypothetical protein [Lentzea kentuckyensis]
MRWRTGNKNARNIYFVTADGDELHVGVMFTESLGRYITAALNDLEATDPPMPGGDISAPARPDNTP